MGPAQGHTNSCLFYSVYIKNKFFFFTMPKLNRVLSFSWATKNYSLWCAYLARWVIQAWKDWFFFGWGLENGNFGMEIWNCHIIFNRSFIMSPVRAKMLCVSCFSGVWLQMATPTPTWHGRLWCPDWLVEKFGF